MSHGLVWRFADVAKPMEPVFDVHSIGRAAGGMTLKATCMRHKKCVCWVSKPFEGSDRFELLRRYMEWGGAASGRSCDASGHYAMSQRLKRSYGMKVKV